jgi:hypothetical protein
MDVCVVFVVKGSSMEYKLHEEGGKDLKVHNGSKKQMWQKKKSHGGHGYLSLVSVVCCQVEVSATSWSLVQRSPTVCGVSKKCDREASKNEAA